jgi:hypothetical protein
MTEAEQAGLPGIRTLAEHVLGELNKALLDVRYRAVGYGN